jgi:hypothetical protein
LSEKQWVLAKWLLFCLREGLGVQFGKNFRELGAFEVIYKHHKYLLFMNICMDLKRGTEWED